MSKEFISVLCPTHKRPQLQRRFAEFVFKNCSDSSLMEIVFGIDNNDTIALEVADELKLQFGDERIAVKLFDPGEKMSNFANLCFSIAKGDIIANAADDVIFRSQNWDIVAREAFGLFKDKIILLWSDDGLWNGELASHTFIHRNWVKALGYVNPPYFVADWTDKWNQEIAVLIGRGVFVANRDHLFLEHMHVEAGKMEKDETHLKTRALANKQNGHFLYNTPELVAKRNEDRLKLIKFIEENNE